MYYYYFNRTPNMAVKRVIMILAASLEFDKKHNSEIIERQSDNDEIPQVKNSWCCAIWFLIFYFS